MSDGEWKESEERDDYLQPAMANEMRRTTTTTNRERARTEHDKRSNDEAENNGELGGRTRDATTTVVRNNEPRWRWRTTNLRWLCEVRTQRQRGGFAKWEHRGGEVACGGRARWLSMQARRRIWNEGGRTESQKMGWERENWEIENEMGGAERGFSGSHVWKQFSLKTM